MQGQTLVQEIIVVMRMDKADCATVEEAMAEIGCSKATFYSYVNFLGIQRHKFPFDRKSYIHRSDVERIKEFIKENK